MSNQILIIEPQHELKFKGSFEQGNTTYMRLTNPSNERILFKIKTTAPKKYCVRPNSGAIEPNSKIDISITPQPVFVDNNEKHKHKFMVQSVVAPDQKYINVDKVFKESTNLMDYKLKCVFENSNPRAKDAGDGLFDYNKGKKDENIEGTSSKNIKRKDFDEANDENQDQGSGSKQFQNTGDDETSEVKVSPELNHLRDEDNKQRHSLLESKFAAKGELDADMKELFAELVQLREAESKLRQENLNLKEELLYKLQNAGNKVRYHSYKPDTKPASSMMPGIAISIGMVLLGIVIAKLFI